jgi:hypothetical protein
MVWGPSTVFRSGDGAMNISEETPWCVTGNMKEDESMKGYSMPRERTVARVE